MPVANTIVGELSDGTASSSTSALLVTIWELGEATGPLLIAPLSELFGRSRVMNTCNMLFIACLLFAARCEHTVPFLAARALNGAAVTTNVLCPAIVGDMFESDKRGAPLSIVTLAPMIGGAVGPAIGGMIAQSIGWRYVLLIAAALYVVCEIVFLLCFRETYKMVILKNRVIHMRQESGQGHHSSETCRKAANDKLWAAITRPFAVLFGSGVLLSLSLFGAFVFSFFYVIGTTLPDILEEIYGFTPAETGSAFLAFSKPCSLETYST